MLLQSLTFHINCFGGQELERTRMCHQPARNEQETTISYPHHHVHIMSVSNSVFVRFLVERGADATAQDKRGWTPLHGASSSGDLDLARFLVKHGANTAAQDERGLTLLHGVWTWHSSSSSMVADPAAQNKAGSTPLHEASSRGHLGLARFLVKPHDADADAATQDERG